VAALGDVRGPAGGIRVRRGGGREVAAELVQVAADGVPAVPLAEHLAQPVTGDNGQGWRVIAMIVVLWRAGLRVQEALTLAEQDLDERPTPRWAGLPVSSLADVCAG
jgi:hypothetical protein